VAPPVEPLDARRTTRAGAHPGCPGAGAARQSSADAERSRRQPPRNDQADQPTVLGSPGCLGRSRQVGITTCPSLSGVRSLFSSHLLTSVPVVGHNTAFGLAASSAGVCTNARPSSLSLGW